MSDTDACLNTDREIWREREGDARWLDQWPHRQRALMVVLLLGVFFAGFGAWKEENDLRRQAETKLANLTPSRPMAPTRNPEGLYQLDQEVGSVGSAEIDIGNSSVVFRGVRSAGKLDARREVEFREYVLTCDGLPYSPPPGGFSGRGGFTAAFLLQCLFAINCTALHLDG